MGLFPSFFSGKWAEPVVMWACVRHDFALTQ